MNLIPQAVERAGMRLLLPLVNLLLRLRVRPNTITTAGTLLVVASAAAFAVGRAHWGGVLLLVNRRELAEQWRIGYRRVHRMTPKWLLGNQSEEEYVASQSLVLGVVPFVLMGMGGWAMWSLIRNYLR